MTHPLPPDDRGEVRQRVSPFAIETNGIGKMSSYHLNLTRCIDTPSTDTAMVRAKARAAARTAEAKAAGISKYDSSNRKRYAGWDRTER